MLVSCIRTRAKVGLGLSLVSALTLASCTSSPTTTSPARGTALQAIGTQTEGTVTIPVHAGKFYLGFPGLRNVAHQPVHVTGYALGTHSASIHIDRFVVFDTRQFGGEYITAYDFAKPEASLHLSEQSPRGQSFVVQPQETTTRFVVAEVSLPTDLRRGNVSGCIVQYTLGDSKNKLYQPLACNFRFGKELATDDVEVGSTSVDLLNKAKADALIFGCPFCDAKGAGLQGAGSEQEGGGVKWLVKAHEKLEFQVAVNGHRSTCAAPAARPLKIAYVITPEGKCARRSG